MRKRWLKWRSAFYAGPRDLGLEPYRRNGYQSPTVTAVVWGYALVARHFTLAGRILLLVSGLLFPYAMVSLLMPIHLLAFAILVLMAVDFVVGLLNHPRLEVVRSLPTRMGAGAEVRIEYRVTNRVARPLLDVAVDTLPLPRGVRLSQGRATLPYLGPRERARAQAALVAEHRGKYVLPAVRADSTFPFNLWRWGCTGDGPQALLVYPCFTPLSRLDLPMGQRYQPGGISLSSKVGESMEFLGCREFRDGDNPRHLHWRSWARTGFPVVKEFREEYLCRAALIVDTFRRPTLLGRLRLAEHLQELVGRDPAFEAVLSLSAAVADYLARQDYVVDLFAAGPQIYRFQGGRSLGYLDNILDILACLQPHPGEPLAELTPALVEETSRISAALVLLLTWNETRRRLIEQMAAAGVAVRAVIVTATGEPPADLPGGITALRAADITEGRCTRL